MRSVRVLRASGALVGARASLHARPTTRQLATMIPVVFRKPDGTDATVNARVGDSLLDVAHENNIDIEGACGGECACSTCHVILPAAVFKSLPAASDEEEDMLDLAVGLTKTSRLGCQVVVTESMSGMTVTLPKEVADMRG